jgi:uncharacterized membrane protein HdeD (DUF308 family)
MSSFGLYLIGTLILVIGVIYICHIAHIPQTWTIGIGILLVGAGIMGAVNNTRQRDRN